MFARPSSRGLLGRSTRSLMALAGAVVLFGMVAACEKDPNEAQTWIDKLGDTSELDEAVRNLERLKDPKSIKPLGAVWKKYHASKILHVIITIAGYTGADPAKPTEPHYADAIPFLVEAVENFDPSDDRSIDDATVACEALGKAHDPGTVQVLISAATKSMPKLSPANRVRVAAIRALGHFKDPRAVDTLMKILNTDPEAQRLQINGAAALALAETGDPKALPALTQAMFIGPIFGQARQGLTRIGKPAVAAMLRVLQEQDPDITKYAKDKNFEKVAPGAVPYLAALILGDLRAKEAVPLLTAGLKQPARYSFIDQKTGDSGPTTHAAYLDALRHIYDPSAAGAVWAYATDKSADPLTRPIAIDVYSMLATDESALPELWKIIVDEKGDPNLRGAAIIAYGRIGRTAEAKKPLDDLVAKYEGKMAEADAKLKAAKTEGEKQQADSDKGEAQAMRDQLKEGGYRIDIAIQCKQDASCYAKALEAKDVSMGKPGLPKAERALIELAKMGPAAASATDTLLKFADSSERIVREGILLALPRIAKLPCPTCAERLNKVIESQSQQTTLDKLNEETKIVYHWFLWAGK